MEIEKAVETLNVMEGQYAHIRHSDAEFEAVEQAKDALREQQEREKGCEYCRRVSEENRSRIFFVSMFDEPDYVGIAYDKRTHKFYLHVEMDTEEGDGDCEIERCPKCGRRLKEAQEDEIHME